MSARPAISVIIPVYNVEKYLPRCLDSVLAQTFSDWEVICINDGSPDNSDKILARYAAADPRFKIITKQNAGLSAARNDGIIAAHGEYILFLDSDDFIHPQTMEIVYSLAQKNNADLVAFGHDEKFYRYARDLLNHGRNIDDLLPRASLYKYNVGNIRHKTTNNLIAHATERNHGLCPGWKIYHCYPPMRLYRRIMIAKIPFIRGIIMEDFPWWSAVMLQRPRTVYADLPLYFYMPNAGSILSSSKALRMIDSIAAGLMYAYNLYCANATAREMKIYNREFLWPFIIIAAQKLRDLKNAEDIRVARERFTELYARGVMDRPANLRARRYRRRILSFINNG